MSSVNEERTHRRESISFAIVLVLGVAAFSIYYYQSQTTIGRLQARGTFSQSITLLPKTNVTLPPCSQNGCNAADFWQWNFPYNMSLQYPGYLNVTVYYSNNTNAFMSASWYWNDGNGGGRQEWDYSGGGYPRTTPAWMLVPVMKGMAGLSVSLLPQTTFTSRQTISISYDY